MKRTGNLWEQLCSFQNLYLAWKNASRHKRTSRAASDFSWNAESELFRLRDELLSGDYEPGAYRLFPIYEPKPRIIAAAPFRDRVVHHALVNIIEPLYEPRFIFDSYATRVGKGTHAALLRFNHFYNHSAYVLKCDVARFFPSINRTVLKSLLRKRIACEPTLSLASLIIDRAPPGLDPCVPDSSTELYPRTLPAVTGLPIGNLTSQFFANVFLDPLDHFIKERLHVKRYVRYMDDFCLFGDDKRLMDFWRVSCEKFLFAYGLMLRYPKTRLYSTNEGVEFLGYRVHPGYRRVVTRSARRMERRLSLKYHRVCERCKDPGYFRQSLASCLGHLKWANTTRLVASIGEHGKWLWPILIPEEIR